MRSCHTATRTSQTFQNQQQQPPHKSNSVPLFHLFLGVDSQNFIDFIREVHFK